MRIGSRDAMRLPMLAGWLFADLMLMLFLVGLSMAALASGGDNGPEAETLRGHTDTMLRHLVQGHPELRDREVGVALIFGAGPRSGIGTAEQRARKVGAVLRHTDGSFRHAVVEPLWTEGSPDFVKMQLYFYSN